MLRIWIYCEGCSVVLFSSQETHMSPSWVVSRELCLISTSLYGYQDVLENDPGIERAKLRTCGVSFHFWTSSFQGLVPDYGESSFLNMWVIYQHFQYWDYIAWDDRWQIND
jgi:hypothetical protein